MIMSLIEAFRNIEKSTRASIHPYKWHSTISVVATSSIYRFLHICNLQYLSLWMLLVLLIRILQLIYLILLVPMSQFNEILIKLQRETSFFLSRALDVPLLPPCPRYHLPTSLPSESYFPRKLIQESRMLYWHILISRCTDLLLPRSMLFCI